MDNTTLMPTTFTTDGQSYYSTTSGFEMANITKPRKCPPEKLTPSQKLIWTVDVAVLLTIFLLATLGNLCVLLVVWLRRKKRTRMHLFIMHLAIADLVVAVFQVLPELLIRLQCGFHGSDFLCRLTKFLQIVGMYGSTYVLVCTAVDRYLAVSYPMQTLRSSKMRVYGSIGGTWIVSALLSIPQIALFQKDPSRPMCRMIGVSMASVQAYVTWFFLSVFILPTCILATCYGLIANVVVKNVRNKRRSQNSNRVLERQGKSECTPRVSNYKNLSKAKIKTVKMTFVIVLTFFACWAPFFIVQILGIWNIINRDQMVSNILHLLASLNSCVNPWIYMGFSGHMLQDLKNTICFWKKKSNSEYGIGSSTYYTRGAMGKKYTSQHTTFSSMTDTTTH